MTTTKAKIKEWLKFDWLKKTELVELKEVESNKGVKIDD